MVVATSGHVAIVPTIRALELGKTVALANKETLVCAGEIIAGIVAANHTLITTNRQRALGYLAGPGWLPNRRSEPDHSDGLRRAIPDSASV